MGREWYEKHGKYLTKKNTFLDFIACAETLCKKGYTSPDKLAIWGASAGGLVGHEGTAFSTCRLASGVGIEVSCLVLRRG
jgi:prolyl oligopeptidase PreP (S9A serine peptidase family)